MGSAFDSPLKDMGVRRTQLTVYAFFSKCPNHALHPMNGWRRMLSAMIIKMPKSKYQLIEIISLLFAIILSLIIAGEASNWNNIFNGWNLWIIFPYIFFLIISLTAKYQAPSINLFLASCITALSLLLLTLFIYIDALFIHISSTSSLVLIFVPFYLFVGGPIIFFITYKVISLIDKRKKYST